METFLLEIGESPLTLLKGVLTDSMGRVGTQAWTQIPGKKVQTWSFWLQIWKWWEMFFLQIECGQVKDGLTETSLLTDQLNRNIPIKIKTLKYSYLMGIS